ncbi:MAG: hypothetical protein JWL83_3082, partial [Actinomycetia bacterium]|nr:hypothetical protein [Actinomycetes bacterium]
STGGRLVRFDASRKSVTRVTRVGLDIGQLTSTPGTVYALAHTAKGVDIVAVDAKSGAVRWQQHVGSAKSMALGPGVLWVTKTAPGAHGNLRALDQTNGTVRTTVALPHLSDGTVATARHVWVGGGTTLQRVNLGAQPTVSQLALGYDFIPLAADATSVWGARLSASQYADQTHLVRLAADDGHPLVDMPYPANSFAMVSDNQAWVTGQYGSIATLDTATAQMIHTGHARTLMSNGPSEIHSQSPNIAWALNTFTGQLVRITPRT